MWADKVRSGEVPKAKFTGWIVGALFIDATCRQSEKKRQTSPVGSEAADKNLKSRQALKNEAGM